MRAVQVELDPDNNSAVVYVAELGPNTGAQVRITWHRAQSTAIFEEHHREYWANISINVVVPRLLDQVADASAIARNTTAPNTDTSALPPTDPESCARGAERRLPTAAITGSPDSLTASRKIVFRDGLN